MPSISLLSSIVALLITCFIYKRLFSRRGMPESLPWAGCTYDGPLARARSTLRSVFHTRELLLEGYHKFSKNDQLFVLPNLFTGPEVILPISLMGWLLDQSDDVLDQNEVNREFLQADFTMLHPMIISDGIHLDVIRKEMTKDLDLFVEPFQDEVDLAFRQSWGVDTNNWVEVCVFKTVSQIITQAMNRIFVGFPLCRNDEYLRNSAAFGRRSVLFGMLLNMMPSIVRPILGPIVSWFHARHHAKCNKFIEAEVISRKLQPASEISEKNNYIDWCLRHAFRRNDPSLASTDLISRRLSVVAFAAIQSSVITLTNLVLDLSHSPLSAEWLQEMRNEIDAELITENGLWTKSGLWRMVILDGALRDSMRLWHFLSRGISKMVVSRRGIFLPDGSYLPRGKRVGIQGYPIHHDEEFYDNAYQFNPFRELVRFIEMDDDEYLVYKEYDGTGGSVYNGQPLSTTSPTFMAFSHGRHACPGRFFVTQELKLALAEIAMNYEFKTAGQRPRNRWFGASLVPSFTHKILVRRRVGTV